MYKLFVITIVWSFMSSCRLSLFDDLPTSSESGLKENYKKKYKEISDLKNYFNSVTPKDLEVYIEFQNDKTIDLKIYSRKIPKYPIKVIFQEWDMNPFDYKAREKDTGEYAPETNSLEIVKARLSWTDVTFKEIKKYLDKANCISVTNGNPTNIGFKRSGMGMFFYNIFDKPLTDSLKIIYNDSCRNRIYNDTVSLEYGGGAIGPQCFPK